MSPGTGGDGEFAHPIVPIILGVLIIAGGGYLYYSGMQATANAEAVDATVVSSGVVDTDDTGSSNDADDYSVMVEYRYTVDGESYTSRNLCPGLGSGCEPSSDFRTDMEDFVDRYPEGEIVTAYVPPSEPSNAYLIQTSPSLMYLVVSGFGVLLVLLGGRRLAGG
ncbi:MAG: DUF3592 domain-containing protein [Halobacteriota archaeon]